jgi:hypothetical protein
MGVRPHAYGSLLHRGNPGRLGIRFSAFEGTDYFSPEIQELTVPQRVSFASLPEGP